MTVPPQNEDPEDFDSIYGGVDLGSYDRPKSFMDKLRSMDSRDTLKDVLGQAFTGLVGGAGGSYGNLASLVGINPPAGQMTSGQQSNLNMQSDILDRINQPGQRPSVSDISALQDDEPSPGPSRFPTTGEIQGGIQQATGIGDPRTTLGGITRKASEIYAGGRTFGQGGLGPAVAAGTAGETAKNLGGGPLVQAAAEIAAMLATQGRSNPLSSTNPEVQSRIAALRAAGYSDQDITLAINASKAGSSRVGKAAATSGSEAAFESTLARSEGLFQDTLTNAFPGLEHGTEHVHRVASDAYGQVARQGRNVTINDPSRFQRVISNVTTRLRNTLGNNPEAQPFITRLEEAAQAAAQSPTADTFINFYKELNRMGKWMNPKEKESLITHVKNGIKSTFRNSGPEGRALAEDFERVNAGIQRAYQAEAITDLLGKATTVDGIDWNKTLKLFDKQSNWDILEAGLGRTQTRNLREIAKVGKEVGDFRKALGSMREGGKLSGWINTAKGASFVYALANGHYKTAAGIAGFQISKEAFARLQTKLLTDERFQNVILRTMKAVKSNSPQELQRASVAFEKIAEEEGIDVSSF